jgi:hypothetical protein
MMFCIEQEPLRGSQFLVLFPSDNYVTIINSVKKKIASIGSNTNISLTK